MINLRTRYQHVVQKSYERERESEIEREREN